MAHGVHDHDELSGENLIDAARDALTLAGEQWTPMRASVFKTLSTFAKPASAYDIAEALSRAEDRRVAANSIYRILDLFVAANIAQRVESKNAYLVNVHPGCRHDCIFLVCDRCGDTKHIDDDRIAHAVRSTAGGAGFIAIRPVMEVRGLCKRCQDDPGSKLADRLN